MCYSAKKSCYLRAKHEAAQPHTAGATNGHGKLCSTEREGVGEEKHLVLICTDLAGMSSALGNPGGAQAFL